MIEGILVTALLALIMGAIGLAAMLWQKNEARLDKAYAPMPSETGKQTGMWLL